MPSLSEPGDRGAQRRPSRGKHTPGLPPRGREERVELMGLEIDPLTTPALIDRMIRDNGAGVGGYLMTPNLDNLRGLSLDTNLMRRAQTADIRVADGMPLLWASRLQRTPLPARVAGSDLIYALANASAAHDRSLFLLGGAPETARLASDELRSRYPGLRIAGHLCPPVGFESKPAEITAIRAALERGQPDFVLVGLPFPKASALIADLRPTLPATWFAGLGVSFSFVCGDVLRAPRWMQRTGLEWVYRLYQEPRRLARRYLLEGLPFAMRLFRNSLAKRRCRRIAEAVEPS